ncbi:NHLP leader peptide family RiPP precursor [Tenacibaculum sp. MEBiC06402]|uniref:NHLP leader peptide family RiPP precursor n=1 Tax=unclassified Tenacibaculum TaxID=2635139 RepID=UPI003B9C34A5
MELTAEQKLFQTIITKAWEDQAFKQELIANPIDTIEKQTGVRLNLPKGKTILVKDQTNESTMYINIPVKREISDVELNEEQLEAVAGGMTIFPIDDIINPPFPPKGCLPPEDIIF